MQSLNMQSLKLCRTRGAAFVLLGTMVLLLAAMPLVQPASAMDCLQETLFYNDWENEELHAQSELFADTEHLPWGTEVCPIGNRQRWLTNWTEVRLEDGRMGWIDAADLVSATEFRDSIHLRHAAAVVELNSLVAEVDDIEVVMRKRGIAVPELNLNIVLLSWLRAGSKPAAVPAAVSEPLLEDVDEPTPMPTVLPSPTPFRHRSRTQSPIPCRNSIATILSSCVIWQGSMNSWRKSHSTSRRTLISCWNMPIGWNNAVPDIT